jgi:hypothetical protein
MFRLGRGKGLRCFKNLLYKKKRAGLLQKASPRSRHRHGYLEGPALDIASEPVPGVA